MAATKSIAQKLLMRAGDRVYVEASDDERALIGSLPDGAVLVDEASESSVAVMFVPDRESLLARFGAVLGSLGAARAVWLCYPKGGRADVNRDVIMRECGAFGWRAISNVAVDETWSAVRVRPLRDGEAPVG